MLTAAVTYREVSERYASSDAAAAAMNKLARIYTDTKRFDIAAATFQKLAVRDRPSTDIEGRPN